MSMHGPYTLPAAGGREGGGEAMVYSTSGKNKWAELLINISGTGITITITKSLLFYLLLLLYPPPPAPTHTHQR